MSKEKPQYPQSSRIFEKTPIDEFIQKHINKLPKKMPSKIKEKLLNDAKFFSEHGMKTDEPKKALDGILENKPKKSEAYPNYDAYMSVSPERDTKKWINI